MSGNKLNVSNKSSVRSSSAHPVFKHPEAEYNPDFNNLYFYSHSDNEEKYLVSKSQQYLTNLSNNYLNAPVQLVIPSLMQTTKSQSNLHVYTNTNMVHSNSVSLSSSPVARSNYKQNFDLNLNMQNDINNNSKCWCYIVKANLLINDWILIVQDFLSVNNRLSELKHSSSLQNYQQFEQQLNNSVNMSNQQLLKPSLKNNKIPSLSFDTTSLKSFNNNLETSSLSSFNLASSKDTLTVNTSLSHDLGADSASNTNIAENYLILDRLNQKQQRKQQLKLKQDLHKQQLNDLKQKQHDLELKMQEAQYQQKNDELNNFNSKLTSHYSISSTNLNNLNNLNNSNKVSSSQNESSKSNNSKFLRANANSVNDFNSYSSSSNQEQNSFSTSSSSSTNINNSSNQNPQFQLKYYHQPQLQRFQLNTQKLNVSNQSQQFVANKNENMISKNPANVSH